MDDEQRWAAVVGRDPSADGAFVYGVLTTGVFCRPSCPSKRAKRANVVFFASPDAAQDAGLRPCCRCRPTGPDAAARRSDLVARACRVIDAALSPPTLDELAADLAVSPSHLHRQFRAETGITPKAYADARRAERVRARLEEGSDVAGAIYDAGFGSNGRFYDPAADRLGMTPSQLRGGGAGLTIRFAVGATSLGAVLVAATDRGICAIDLGDDPEHLVLALQDRFPAAELVGDDPAFGELVARVVALVEDPAKGAALPLDIQGTAFQERVWRALRLVPAGTTVTYTELAERLGAPRSARAVAAACAANTLAVAVPCHRVVRRDGDLAGYRWGVDRKAALLEREAAGAAHGDADDRISRGA